MVYIYVLKLQNSKYYVGKTSNPYFRIESQFKSEGSEWTKIHKPVKLLKIIEGDDYDEDKYTKIYMDKYGIDNVRGGSYTSVKLDKQTKNQLVKISNSTNNRCFKCGKEGHFAKNCYDDKKEFKDENKCIYRENKCKSKQNYDNSCFKCRKYGHYEVNCYQF